MGIASLLSPFAIVRQLRLGAESSTFERLGRSRHVADLRLIFSVSIIMMIVSTILALAFCFEHQVMTNWQEVHARESGWIWLRLGFAAIVDSGAFIGAYRRDRLRRARLDLPEGQRAARRGRSVRLRDRHAVSCRRGVRHGAPLYRPVRERPAGRAAACHRWRKPGRHHPLHLAGELFSGVRRLGDGPSGTGGRCRQARHRVLHLHEGDARFAAQARRSTPPEPGGPHDDDWHRAICSVLYMLFLGLESARKAIKDLVEFEPKQAEDMITILLSELLAYGFLREQFRGDLRQRRLEARDEAYRREIPALHRLVVVGAGPQWDAAKDLSAEMMRRFDRVLVDTPTERARKAARGLLEAVS